MKSKKNLRYIYTIHEVINDKDNVIVMIPETESYIYDKRYDYMEKRTIERKNFDLKLLYEIFNNSFTITNSRFYFFSSGP